jgi:hypothetical protein
VTDKGVSFSVPVLGDPMARARVKRDRKNTDIADAIIAEWYRILPDPNETSTRTMDANALTAAFNRIIDNQRCQAILDEKDKPIKIVVPLPPPQVTNREQLLNYLMENDDFRQGMAAAVLFGCGR